MLSAGGVASGQYSGLASCSIRSASEVCGPNSPVRMRSPSRWAIQPVCGAEAKRSAACFSLPVTDAAGAVVPREPMTSTVYGASRLLRSRASAALRSPWTMRRRRGWAPSALRRAGISSASSRL